MNPTTLSRADDRSCRDVARRPWSRRERRLALALTWAVAWSCGSGCQVDPPGFERFVPEPGAGRAAVAAALDSWKRGEPTDAVVAKRPEVHVVDKQRRPGQRVTAYEIIGEFPAENARGYAVRLTYDDTAEKALVRYLVVGTDPIWIFRQEDYEMISHWMHPMKEPEDRASGPEPTP
jgi:hypothetical protein